MSTSYITWGTGDEAPMIVHNPDGSEIVIPFDDAAEVMGRIAETFDISVLDLARHFVHGDELHIDYTW